MKRSYTLFMILAAALLAPGTLLPVLAESTVPQAKAPANLAIGNYLSPEPVLPAVLDMPGMASPVEAGLPEQSGPNAANADAHKVTDELMKNYLASVYYTPASVAIPELDNIPYPLDPALPPPDMPVLTAPVKAAKKAATLKFRMPLDSMVLSSVFGFRWGRMHEGIDLAANAGTPIHAAEAGRVAYAGWAEGYGNFVVIDHGGGISTRYGHAATLAVAAGQSVKKGQTIARVGSTGHSTGPHLHFEVVTAGQHHNPIDFFGRTIRLAKN